MMCASYLIEKEVKYDIYPIVLQDYFSNFTPDPTLL